MMPVKTKDEAAEEARQFSAQQRKKLAKKGQAQPGGSFPIANEQDLRNAIAAYGRSKNKAATKAHIIKRARALGLTRLLPDAWKVSTASQDRASLLNLHIDCPECERSFLHEDAL